jgi:hypothetical protein
MSIRLHKINLFTLGLVMTGLAFLVSCGDDNDTVEIDTVTEYEWYAAGNGVAPLFRAFPLEIDSIYLRFRVTRPWEQLDTLLYRIYFENYEKTGDDYQRLSVITGADQPSWGAPINREETAFDNIISFSTQNAQLDGTPIQITGIYKVFDNENPPHMNMEYVYDGSDWPNPPDAAMGFGSTAYGDYGENNVHQFTMIIRDEETEEE